MLWGCVRYSSICKYVFNKLHTLRKKTLAAYDANKILLKLIYLNRLSVLWVQKLYTLLYVVSHTKKTHTTTENRCRCRRRIYQCMYLNKLSTTGYWQILWREICLFAYSIKIDIYTNWNRTRAGYICNNSIWYIRKYCAIR